MKNELAGFDFRVRDAPSKGASSVLSNAEHSADTQGAALIAPSAFTLIDRMLTR